MEVDEYQAKYLILVKWTADKTGLTEDEIDLVIDNAYNELWRKELEDYCEKLYDGE
jgi:hypothetical protein